MLKDLARISTVVGSLHIRSAQDASQAQHDAWKWMEEVKLSHCQANIVTHDEHAVTGKTKFFRFLLRGRSYTAFALIGAEAEERRDIADLIQSWLILHV
jgi:hypothetical protein